MSHNANALLPRCLSSVYMFCPYLTSLAFPGLSSLISHWQPCCLTASTSCKAVKRFPPCPEQSMTECFPSSPVLAWTCSSKWWGHLGRREYNVRLLPLGSRKKEQTFFVSWEYRKSHSYYCGLWHVLEGHLCHWTESQFFLRQRKVCMWVKGCGELGREWWGDCSTEEL